MNKRQYAKKVAASRGKSGARATVGGIAAAKKDPSNSRTHFVVGANPPQELTQKAKATLESMTPDHTVLERVATLAASSKVKKKVSYDF